MSEKIPEKKTARKIAEDQMEKDAAIVEKATGKKNSAKIGSEKKENLHAGHRQRLIGRAKREGINTLDPHQVIELLLFYSIPRRDTSDTAHRLINQFGGVGGVLTASEKELCDVYGIGKKSAQWLKMLGDVAVAYDDTQGEKSFRITNVRTAMEFCESCRSRISPPCVCQACTTTSGKILNFTEVSNSTDWGDFSVMRQALRDALVTRPKNILIIVLVDEAKPTVGEYEKTCAHKYAYTVSATGVELLDVILVGRNSMVSMYRERHLLRHTYGGARSSLAAKYLRENVEDVADAEELPAFEDELPAQNEPL